MRSVSRRRGTGIFVRSISRLLFLATTLTIFGVALFATRPTVVVAQESKAATTDEDSSSTKAPPVMPQRTLMDSIKAGGITGLVIIVLSVVAVGLMVEHAITIRKSRLMPEEVLHSVGELVQTGQVQKAADYCRHPEAQSMVTEVMLAGIERFQNSEFGFAEYKQACEEAGEEETNRLYRKVDYLNLIGVIAPMLGLLGTVEGMIEAFNTIASKSGPVRPDELADSISKALVTTFEGLVVAIPAMVAYSFFRNKIDSLVADAGKRVERILAPLARNKQRYG
jgi:biopolymer transport protein ExbB